MKKPSFPNWGKIRNNATNFLEFSTVFFPECICTNVNQMTSLQKAVLTDLENQMEQAEFVSCHLINIEIAVDSLLLKIK